MKNLYHDNWFLYKAQAEGFNDDFDYYLNLCRGKKTLEIFAGYGRVSNMLLANSVDLETVELDTNFAQFINLPQAKNHICDVLKFDSDNKYECIISAYNSFPLLTNEGDILAFFKRMCALLCDGGVLSLSYYPLDSWKKEPPIDISVGSVNYRFTNDFDLSSLEDGIAVWIDKYDAGGEILSFRYPTRIYRDDADLLKYTENTNLLFTKKIINYGRNIPNETWIEYVFTKKTT